MQSSWTEYTGFLEAGCDACLLVGMHAMAGTPDGVLSHTVSGREWRSLRFNGVLVGETGINAALCGNWNCPVLLVTGDEATCREATALLGDGLTTVAVKTGIAVPPHGTWRACAREVIEEGARNALKKLDAVKPYDPGRPAEIAVEFLHPGEVDKYAGRQGVEVTGPESVVSRGADWWTAWRQLSPAEVGLLTPSGSLCSR